MTQTKTWLEALPKVELHLHLEGAIPLGALWQLVQKYGGDPNLPNQDSLKNKFIYQDFPHFLETWIWKNGYIREYEDFTFIGEAVAGDLAGQHIKYAEAFYSPPEFNSKGLETQLITEAMRKGLNRVPQVEVALVADLVRNLGPEQGVRTLQELNEVKNFGVIGIGIGGAEHLFPPEPYAAVYEQARRLGFHTTAHAGEAAGPASIWGAIRALKVERIGHGTRAVEDPALVDYLFEKQIPIEMCPLSNQRTGVIPDIQAHPARQFFDRGLLVTVNTDDPKMFNNSLVEEYEVLMDKQGFSRDEIRSLILNGIRASWLAEKRKEALRKEFCAVENWAEEN